MYKKVAYKVSYIFAYLVGWFYASCVLLAGVALFPSFLSLYDSILVSRLSSSEVTGYWILNGAMSWFLATVSNFTPLAVLLTLYITPFVVGWRMVKWATGKIAKLEARGKHATT